MAIKFSQFNLRTDHTSGMYLVGYDGNQNIHITVDNLFNDFINGTENTIAMFGTGGTVLADSILSQNAGATLLTVGGQLNVDAAATFDTSVTVTGDSALNGNVTLGDASTDLITQTGTLYLNGPVKDTADTLGAVDQILVSDATGELTFQDLLDTHVGSAEVVKVPVKNVQGSALVKGDPVYISGSVGASGRLQVQLADASNTLKMPSVGLLFQDLANNGEGYVVITGKLRNIGNSPIDGVTPTEGDVVYVKPSGTSGAALTTTKPVYGNFIQNVGKVGRVSTNSDGTFVVSSILRTNDIPNLTPGRLWVGSTGNTIESQTLFVDEANERLGIGTTSPGYKLDVQTTGTADLANFETTGTAGIRIANSNASFATRITSSNTATGLRSDGNIKFFTDGAATGTERMIIENSTGDVGIGVGTPDTRLHIKDDTSNNVAKFESVGSERSSISLKTDATSNNQAFLIFTTSADGYRRVALGPTNNPGSRDMLKIEKQILPNYTSANMNFGGTGVGNSSKFTLNFDYDTDQDSNFNGFYVDANLSGTTALTGDRTVSGINVDMDSSAAGGNTAQELTLRGINVDVGNHNDGDAHHIYGVYARANSTRNGAGDNISDITGGYFQALNSAKTGQVSNMYGTYSYALLEDATHTISDVYGSFSRARVNTNFDGTISTKVTGSRVTAHLDDSNNNLVPRLIGADVENIIDSNLAISEGVNVVKDINNNLTITDSYLFKGKVEKPASSTITNNWGLYLENVDKNYLDGTLRLPTYGQGNVTGTATKNLAVDSNGNVIETEGGVVDGSGTANYVSKWSDANTLTDSQIFDNGTNVGIGTSSPGVALDVDASTGIKVQNASDVVFEANPTAGTFSLGDTDGVGGTAYITGDSTNIDFFGDGDVRFQNTGNVGIGTASPTGKLTIRNSGSGNSAFQVQDSGGAVLMNLNEDGLGNAEVRLNNSSATQTIRLDTSGSSYFNGGNVGIGTDAPDGLLHVSSGTSGDAILVIESDTDDSDNSDNPHLEFRQDGNTIRGKIGLEGTAGQTYSNSIANATYLGTVFEQSLQFITGNTGGVQTAKMTIQPNTGNVGIGTTSPSQKLEVNGNVAANRYYGHSNTTYYVDPNDTSQAAYFAGDIRITDSGTATIKLDSTSIYPGASIVATKDGSESPPLGDISWVSNPGFQGSTWAQRLTNSPYTESSIKLPTSSSYNFAIKTLGSDRMVINSSGNVGIGTTNPGQKLDVIGNVKSQFNSGDYAILESNGSGGLLKAVSSTSTTVLFRSYGDSYIINNLGIGTNNPAAKLDVDGSFKLSDYTSTSVTTTGSLDPNQNYQAPTQDTLADLTVDPSGNVVRGMQEGTWTFTKAQLDGTLGMTLISAPGTNKAIIVYESSWMIKYNATGTINTNQRYEIRQASNTGVGPISILPGLKINEILSNGQTMPGGGASAYGFYSRDVPADAGGRTFKTNTATTLHKNNNSTLPSGVQTVSIKLRYRIYNATTF